MKNTNKFNLRTILQTAIIILVLTLPASAWINGVGSPSLDPKNPAIGTHDRIINSAIYMLPVDLQNKIDIVAADYGSEMPDYNKIMCKCIYGLRDQKYHQVYYWKNGTIQDDSAARRAQEEYDLAMQNLSVGDKYNFSIHIGMMSHYISDVSNFAHTMGNKTDWGPEGAYVHGDYENYVAGNSNLFFSAQNMIFDGKYDNITIYNATLDLAEDTIFDDKFGSGKYTNVIMNKKIGNSISVAIADPKFVSRVQQSLNYNVNMLTDVLYEMVSTPTPPKGDILSYYRGFGQSTGIVETADLLKAADDWRNNIVSPGSSISITTTQLLTLADEWRNS
jgi:hypothetical protein